MILTFAILLALPAAARDATEAPETLGALNVPDVSLVDQDGKPVRFYTDLVKDRVVAVNSCSPPAPPSARPAVSRWPLAPR